MIQAGTGFSRNRISDKAVQQAARAACQNAGITKADAAIFFSSTFHRKYYASILEHIKKITGADHVIGASTGAVITDQGEFERSPGIGVMVFASDKIDMRSFLISNLQESSYRAGQNTAHFLREAQIETDLMLLFPDPFSFQSHTFFDGFESSYGYIPMIGGSCSEDGAEEKTYQFLNNRISYDSVCGLALQGNLRTEMGITRSCQPFGDPYRITRSEGNVIYEMDGRPAYDIFLESISSIETSALNTGKLDQVFQHVFLGTPLRSFQTEFSSNFMIRNIMGVNAQKGMLSCVAPVEEGDFVTFAVRNAEMARADMKRMLEDLQYKLTPTKPSFGFYFNCCARGQALYHKPNADISMIRQAFPETPILGLFAYGEIAPVDHVNHLHHHSGILVLVAEDD